MTFLIIFLVALAVSAVGFHRYIWFISIGYGFSIAAIGTALLIMFGVRHELTAATAVMAALLVVYGLRLGGYLLAREYRSSSYHQVMQQAIDNGSQVKLPLKLLRLGGLRIALCMRGLANCVPLAESCGNRRRRHCGRGDHGRWHHARIRRGSHEEPVQAATPAPLLRCRALPHGALPGVPRRDRRLDGRAHLRRHDTRWRLKNGSPQSAATCASAGSCSAARADSSCDRTRNMQTTRNTGTIPNTHRFSSRSSRCTA